MTEAKKRVKVVIRQGSRSSICEVEGRYIKFSDFNEFQFILHRACQPSLRNEWRVSEATTGQYCAVGKTPNEAMKNAKQCLLDAGRKIVRDKIEKAIKERVTIAQILNEGEK